MGFINMIDENDEEGIIRIYSNRVGGNFSDLKEKDFSLVFKFLGLAEKDSGALDTIGRSADVCLYFKL